MIEQIHIYGFGKWSNVTFDMNSSLTIIKGHNESGKTSIKQFILYVLFDLPLQTKKQYEPKDGSRFGGKVFLRNEQNEFIIVERSTDRNKGKAICFVEGVEYGEERLKLILNGMDRHTFENIFAFDDQELQRLSSLKGEEIGKVLFGIGLSGSDHITKLDKSLVRKMDEWFKKKGKKPIINEQIGKINDLQKQVKQLEEQQENYNKLVEQRNTLNHKLAETKSEIDESKVKKRTTEKYLQAKEAIQNYQYNNEKLKEMEKVTTFPEMGIERLQQLKEWILPIESERHATNNKLEKVISSLHNKEKALLPDERYEQLKGVEVLAQDFYVIEKQIKEKTKEIESTRLFLSEERQQLGVENSLNLKDYSLSIFTEEKWKTLAKAKEQLNDESQRLQSEVKSLEQDQELMTEKVHQEESNLLGEEELRQLKEQMDHHQQSKWKEHFIQEQQLQQKKDQQKIVRKVTKLAQGSFLFGVISLLLGLMYGFFTHQNIGYFIGGIVFILSFLLRSVLLKNTKGLHVPVISEPINTADTISKQEYEALQNKQMKHEDAKNNVKNWTEKLEETQRILLHCKEKQDQVTASQKRLQEEMENEQETYPFLKVISVEYWPAFFHKIILLQKKEQELFEKEEDLERLKGKVEHYRQIGTQLLQVCHIEVENQDELWNALLSQKAAEIKNRNVLEQLQEEKRNLQETLQKLDSKLAPYKQEKQELLNLANVSDEEAFMKKGKLFLERSNLLIKQQEWLQHIQFVCTEDVKPIVESAWNWDEVFSEKARLAERIELLEEKRNKQMQQLADCKAQLKQLEENEQLSELRHQLSLLKNELREQVKQWMTYKAAHSFLHKTKEVYQKEYLPEIVERASHYLERLTKGRYIKVLLPIDDETIRVETVDRILFDVTQLSTGTTAQTYVALRLALSEVMNHSYGVPFLIDDAFVHFDGVRRKEMFTILEEISKQQQIMYFTCNDTYFHENEEIKAVMLEENTTVFTR
ncbi:ATP-binding protein [Salirhabdus sp. Marseille-P4669]|uniref:ATP-binding protein n=1 Tax=Salirhabdus sp. Marseille-P4669 TaxID=2042310 RepID=UPI00135BA8A8|nr:AAA family ATPase [Salirhabdus sp. Marseille-P4669]